MDALELLTADHNRVRGLFAQCKEKLEADDTKGAEPIVAKIIDELNVHTRIEEEIFYPAVRDLSSDIGKVVDEGLEEHKVAKTLLGEITGLGSDDEMWAAKVKVLIESVEHHAEEEEEEMFPSVRSSSDADLRKDIGNKLEVRKKDLGAPTAADNEGRSADELKKMASEQQIPGRSSMDVEELRATVAPG